MRAHHRNLVSFIGYYDEGLTWKQRLHIPVDAARRLEYLHDGCKPPILHRDLKLSNILLNETLQAKIAECGISKALETKQLLSDAYNFGIVLLELITGRPAIIRDVEPVHFERMEIESIVDSIVHGTYKYSSVQTAIETALACVSKTPTERP
ncbi:hypothetical protein PRUPE_8G038300 [Prunus persica]|uniref:Uncharacterized protein n=1 Tax=Prunus persica TaxID=3760 RepID=M5VY90_PRUPE|nr:hypothetical protein PRUPE_8G038300 [Prunus persica]